MPQRILPALFLIIALVPRTGAETPPVIQWQDQRLSITAKNGLLADILRTVAQQTGVEMQGLERGQDIVSLQLSQVPLHTAIQHLTDAPYATDSPYPRSPPAGDRGNGRTRNARRA